MITDFDTPDLDSEFAMIRLIFEVSGRPLSVSLAQRHGQPESWRAILAKIDEIVPDGLPIVAQVALRPIGVLLGLQASTHPFGLLPAYQKIADEPLSKRLETLRNAGFRARMLQEMAEAAEGRRRAALPNFKMIFPLGTSPDYEPAEDKSLFHMGLREGRPAAEVAYDALMSDDGRAFLFSPFSNYAHFNLDACGEMISSANTIMGLGDGGAHVGMISHASFTTSLLTDWARDPGHGRMDLSTLIRAQTRDTACAVGLRDRGVIAPGMKADINVIEFDRLGMAQPVRVFDLPAGGKRLLQRATGHAHTFVSGVETYRNGEPLAALRGRLVRGAQPTPAIIARSI